MKEDRADPRGSDDFSIHRSPYAVQRCWTILGAIALLMGIGYAMLRGGAATVRGNEMNVDRATFVLVNAVTNTGFRLTSGPDDYKLPGQLTVFVLMSCGALGSLIIGGWALLRITGMPYGDDQMLHASIMTFVLAVLGGSAALIGHGVGLWPAIFQATSAFGNCGLVLGQLPSVMDWRTHLVLLPLALVGGAGMPVVLDLFSSAAHLRRPNPHTTAALASLGGVYIAGLGLLLLIEWLAGGEIRQAILTGSAEAINARSLGMAFSPLSAVSRSAQWIILVLMMIGAAPAGTGGGLKSTTLLVLGRDTWRLLAGRSVERIFGLACAWVAIYATIVLAATVLLAATEPQTSGDLLLFLAVSATGNVGLSHEPLTIGGAGLYVLSAAMLLGRLVPLGILWWTVSYDDEVEVAVA